MVTLKPKAKWKFAIGTTSRVPSSGGFHYLIADFDTNNITYVMNSLSKWNIDNMIFQRTPHGWHLYTNSIDNFDMTCYRLAILKADRKWVEIGKRRGYFFLADKDIILFPWAVEHMVIKWSYNGKKETQYSRTS